VGSSGEGLAEGSTFQTSAGGERRRRGEGGGGGGRGVIGGWCLTPTVRPNPYSEKDG